jgi:hypothetical protein
VTRDGAYELFIYKVLSLFCFSFSHPSFLSVKIDIVTIVV